jgi:hypothetical protein
MACAHITEQETDKDEWFEAMELAIDLTDASESKTSRHDPQNGSISKQPFEYGKPSRTASSLERPLPRSSQPPVRHAGAASFGHRSIHRVRASVDLIDGYPMLFPWTTSPRWGVVDDATLEDH